MGIRGIDSNTATVAIKASGPKAPKPSIVVIIASKKPSGAVSTACTAKGTRYVAVAAARARRDVRRTTGLNECSPSLFSGCSARR